MSSELPSQLLLQQHSARPVSGEELETYGKHAASGFQCGEYSSLTQAVVETVKQAGLAPEQVRRVVEFANTHAFISEFRKTAEPSKYVFFKEGLADPAEVIKDLNDGGGGTVFDRGLADYASSPRDVKTASARLVNSNLDALEKTAGVSFGRVNEVDQLLEAAFKAEGPAEYPYENPTADVEDVQHKLAAARDNATAELSELELLFVDAQEDLYQQVKQAALQDMPMGHVLQAWVQGAGPSMEHVEAAWSHIGNRLVEEKVVPSFDALGASLEKTADARMLTNDRHPLVRTFAGYCEVLNKLASTRAYREELVGMEEKVGQFLHLADNHLAGAAQ